ncbi:high mobility group box domain-containing protein, partial [Lasiosphaeria miniovina]
MSARQTGIVAANARRLQTHHQQQQQQRQQHRSETSVAVAPLPSTSTTSSPSPSSSLHRPPPPSSSSTSRHPPPHSPRGPLTRKRAASINTDEANHPLIESLSLNTPIDFAGSRSSPRPLEPARADLICLCTPAPKIPRPRNAFILYRQHHQAQVVAQNPGLANPEISKIIGEQWRDEPEERKNQWKRLAE